VRTAVFILMLLSMYHTHKKIFLVFYKTTSCELAVRGGFGDNVLANLIEKNFSRV